MATFTEIKIPTNTDYGWAFDFFEQNSVDLPPGCALLITIQSDAHPAQWYFDRGVTGVLVNVGVENSTWDTLGIPVSRRFVLTGQSFVRGPVNNKPFNQWVASDVELSVAAWFNARACQYITTDSDEFYDAATGGTGERYEQNSAMWVLMERRMGEEAAARGQEYYGHYGATFKPSDPTNPKLRAALASGAAMLTHLQDQTIGGGATQFPYWAENLFDHPVHCVANAYYIGSSDAHARLHELDAQLSGMRMAMTETGRNRKIMLYTEGVDNEMTGYTAFYKRTLPGGGYLLHAQWPGIDFGYMLTQYFWGFLDCDAVNGWKPDQLFGTNPNIIPPDFVNSDNVQTIKYFPEDDNQFTPQRATPATLSTRGQNPSPYPVYPIGFENSIGVAAQWLRKAYDATGTKAWKRPVLTMNGQTYTPGAGHTFLSTIYDQRLPYVRGYKNPDTGNGWMQFMYQGGKTPVTVTANLDGIEKTIRLLPGVPRFFTFTGTAPVSNGTGWFDTHVGIGPVVYVSLEGDSAVLAARLRVISTAHAGGCNIVCLVIIASSMQYQDWSSLNTVANHAVSLGMKITLRLALAPTADWVGHAATDFLPALPASLTRMKKQDGQVFTGPGNTVSFSMYDTAAIQWYVDTVTVWTNYFLTQSWSTQVVGVEAAFGATQELQYDFNTYVGNGTIDILAGYEPIALSAFRVQLQNAFTTIAALNSACGTNYSDFNAIQFPTPNGAMATAFAGVLGSYFALHRVYGLKRFIDAVYGKLRELVPSWTRILDAGSYDDNLSLQRGTTNPALLAGTVIEMRKTNGQLGFPHERNLDECCVGGLMGANEIDYAQDTGSNTQGPQGKYDQIWRTINRGGRLMTLNCYGIADADLNALLTWTTDLAGATHPNVAGLTAAGPVLVTRNTVQTITFDEWTHLTVSVAYNVDQEWHTLYGTAHPGIDIHYESPVLTP